MAFYNTDKWQLRYQRNNKQNGLKNIRCFPYCSDPHRLSGFCGHSLVFLLGELLPSNATRTNFLAYGEFTLKDSKTIHQGDVITREIALSNQRRNGDDLFKPWFPGDVELIDRQIIFNKQKKGWHYSWISNKHTSESEHVFRVYLFNRTDSNLTCLGTYDSPAFTIFCRRRDKSGVARLPPQFLVAPPPPANSSNANSPKLMDELKSGINEQPATRPKRIKRADEKQQLKKPAKANQLMIQKSATPPLGGLSPSAMMVLRILAALTKVNDNFLNDHQSEVIQGEQNTENMNEIITTPISASSASSCSSCPTSPRGVITTTSTSSTSNNDSPLEDDILGFSKVISDCWDWLACDAIDNDFFQGLEVLEKNNLNPQNKSVEELLIRLGDCLMKEDFTAAIEDIVNNANPSNLESSKEQVLASLKEKFEHFFTQEGTSLEEVSNKLDQFVTKHDEINNLPQNQLFSVLDRSLTVQNNERSPVLAELVNSKTTFRITPGSPFDFTGHWRRPPATLEALEKIRSIMGVSWLERKLIEIMESDFFIWYEGNVMFAQGQRRLSVSNCVVSVIDGKEYFHSSAIPGLGLSSRTWLSEDGAINFCVTYSIKHRMLRKTKKSCCGNRLESIVSLQTNQLDTFPGVWVDSFVFPTCAFRANSTAVVNSSSGLSLFPENENLVKLSSTPFAPPSCSY